MDLSKKVMNKYCLWNLCCNFIGLNYLFGSKQHTCSIDGKES